MDKKCLAPKLNKMVSGYYFGELSAEDRVKFEEHMFACNLCFQQLEELDVLIKALKSDKDYIRSHFLTPKDLAELKSRFQSKRPFLLSPKLAYGVSVIMLIVVSVLVYQVARERSRREELNKTIAALAEQNRKDENAIAELSRRLENYSTPSALRQIILSFLGLRAGEGGREVERPTTEEPFLNLQITIPGTEKGEAYTLTIVQQATKHEWTIGPIRPDDYGNFNVWMKKEWLTPGAYVLKLSDTGAEYRFNVK